MSCQKYEVLIQRELDNDLNEQEIEELQKHIESCNCCCQLYKEYQKLHEELLDLPQILLEDSSVEKLINMHLTEKYSSKKLWKFNTFFRSVIAAAVILLAFFLGKATLLDHNQSADYGQLQMESMGNEQAQIQVYDNIMPANGDNNDGMNMRIMVEEDAMIMEMPTVDISEFVTADYEVINVNDAPQAIKDWVNLAKDVFAGHSTTYRGNTYVFVAIDNEVSSNQNLQLVNVYKQDEQLLTHIEITEFTQSNIDTTHDSNSILVKISGEYIDVDFNSWQGANIETWIPGIYGNSSLPIFLEESSTTIKISSPVTNAKIQESFIINGIARTFDGLVHYQIIDDNAIEIASGSVSTARSAPDWGYFEQEIFIDFPDNYLSEISLQLFEVNISDGSKQNIVNIPLTVSN